MAEVKDEKSPFFDKPRVLENEVAFVIRDGFPVSEGATASHKSSRAS